jgi:hypothetical protein
MRIVAQISEQLYPILSRYFVIARNVVNVKDIENYLKDRATGVEEIDKWLNTSFRKYMINTFDKTNEYKAKPTDPEWMQKANDLVAVDLSPETDEKVSHLIDYLKAYLTDHPGKKLANLQADEALKKSVEWLNALLKKKTDEETEGKDYKVLKNYGEYRWLDLISENALAREGKLMGHCVGGYWSQVEAGSTKIFSLRDKANEPHCTIEFSTASKQIDQIKGKGNQEVVEKYREYILDFLNTPLVPFRKVEDYDLQRSYLLKLKTGYIDVNKIPEGAEIDGDLNLKKLGRDIKLPKNLKISGELILPEDIEELPENLRVKTLKLINTNIERISPGLHCHDLDMTGCSIEELPPGTHVERDLIADFSQLKKLPNNMILKGDLNLCDCPMTELPKGLQVAGELDIEGTSIKSLPADLVVGDAIFITEGVEYPEEFEEQIHVM